MWLSSARWFLFLVNVQQTWKSNLAPVNLCKWEKTCDCMWWYFDKHQSLSFSVADRWYTSILSRWIIFQLWHVVKSYKTCKKAQDDDTSNQLSTSVARTGYSTLLQCCKEQRGSWRKWTGRLATLTRTVSWIFILEELKPRHLKWLEVLLSSYKMKITNLFMNSNSTIK